MKRVGIFAGSFDPIHDGHIAVAESAIKYLELDKLFFMVEKNPWSPKKPIDINHRKTMLDLAVSEYEKIEQLNTDDERFDLQTTLPKIEKLFPDSELFFVFGADVFLPMNAEQWPGLHNLLKHYVVVFERDKITEDRVTAHAKELGIVVAIIPSMYPQHSSTAVRLQTQNNRVLVPKIVADYIDQNNLY